MTPNQYHSVLVALDQALTAFQDAGGDISASDRQLLWRLEVIRSQILRAESGHPFSEMPPPVALRPPEPPPRLLPLEPADSGADGRTKRIRIVVADDHDSVRTILRALLSTETDMDVVAEATNGREAVEVVSAGKPDVVIMDLNMPLLDGITATREALRESPDSKVLVFSANRDPASVQKAADAGAVGYLFKPSTRQTLVNAVRDVQRGRTVFPDRAAVMLARR